MSKVERVIKGLEHPETCVVDTEKVKYLSSSSSWMWEEGRRIIKTEDSAGNRDSD